MEFCTGSVFHIRPSSALKLRYNVFMMLLDLDNIENKEPELSLLSLISSKIFKRKKVHEEESLMDIVMRSMHPFHIISSWSRSDHFFIGDKHESLTSSVKALVEKNSNISPNDIGKIYLLTNPRYFGLSFNPVSIYYCYKKQDPLSLAKGKEKEEDSIIAVVLEVSNTPWLERRLYVLPFGNDDESGANDKKDKEDGNESEDGNIKWKYSYRWKKDFHVSPFMDMLHDYNWKLNNPIQDKEIHVRAVSYRRDKQPEIVEHDRTGNHTTGFAPTIPSQKNENDKITFVAGLNLKMVDLYSWEAVKSILYQPFLTWMVLLWIHIHAFIVWYNGKPYVNPPTNSPALGLKDALKHIFVFTVSGIWMNIKYIFIFCLISTALYSLSQLSQLQDLIKL